jgi:hypothetical protein
VVQRREGGGTSLALPGIPGVNRRGIEGHKRKNDESMRNVVKCEECGIKGLSHCRVFAAAVLTGE